MTNKPIHNNSASIADRGAGADNLQLLKITIDSSLNMIQVFKAVRNGAGEIVDFVWVLNNAASIRIYGDVIGKSLLQLQPGVVEEGIFDAFRQVVETGNSMQYEKHYVHEQFNGWYHQSVVKLNDGVATTTANITELKRAEQELLKSKTLLQHIIDAPRIGMAVYRALRNESGEIVDFIHEYINRASLEMLGGEDFTGKPFLAHGKNALDQMPKFIQAIETGQRNSYTREANLIGKQFWFAITNTPIDEDRLVHTWEDVTEQKNAEREILQLKDEIAQEAIDKYDSLFNSIDEGFCLIELIYDEGGKPVDWYYYEANPTFEKQLGFNPVGKTIRELVGEVEPYWFEVMDRVVKTGKPERFENYNHIIDRWFSIFPSRVGEENSRLIAVVLDDITERKRRELNRELLNDIGNDLSRLTSPDEIMQAVGERLGKFMHASTCIFADVDEEKNEATIHQGWNSDNVPSLKQTFQLADYFGEEFRRAGRAGEAVVVADTQQDERANAEAYRKLQIGSFVAVPFQQQGRWKANITVTIREARQWRQDEVDLIHEIANRVFPRIERARAEESLRKSEEKYRTLFETIDEGFCIIELIDNEKGKTVDWRLLAANEVYERQCGLSTSAVGKLMSEYLPQMEQFWIDGFEKVAKTGIPWRTENYNIDTNRQYSVFVSRLGSEVSQQVAVVFNDITERKNHERRQSFLLELSDALKSLSDPAEIQSAVTELLSEYFDTARCYYMEIDEENHLATMRSETLRANVPSNIGTYDLSLFEKIISQLRSGEALVIKNWDENVKDKMKIGGNGKEVMTEQQVVSQISVPLIKEDKLIGTFTVMDNRPRNWTEHDVTLMLETADRTWAAVVRAKTEEALRASQKRFQSIANLVPDLLWDSEPDGSTNWYNDRWLAYTGQSFEQAIGWGWVDAVHPDDREGSAKRYTDAVKSGTALRQEHRIRRYDGEYRWFVVTAFPLKDEDGKVIKMYGAATDIHDRKQAEEALQQAHEAYRIQLEREVRDRTLELITSRDELEREQHFLEQVTDKAPLLIYVYDLGEDRFTYINKRVEELIGKTEEYIYAMGPHLFQAILHPEDLSRYTAYMKGLKNLSGGQVTENDFRIWNGSQFRWFRSRDSVFREEKKQVLQVIGIAEDVTYEKMLEDKLQSKGPVGLN